MNNLIEHINDQVPISRKLEKAIKSTFKEEQIKKRTLLLKEHNYVRKLYFVSKGI